MNKPSGWMRKKKKKKKKTLPSSQKLVKSYPSV